MCSSGWEKLEIETGEKVVTQENYLAEPESRKRLKGM
jgi:DNA-damage-inducible protein D